MRRGVFIVGGLLVALLLAGLVSPFAAGTPDGLEYALQQGCSYDDSDEVVDGECIAEAEEDHALAGSPFFDYGLSGVENDALGTAVSGVIGVLLTFAVGGGLFWLLRSRRTATAAPASTATSTAASAPTSADES